MRCPNLVHIQTHYKSSDTRSGTSLVKCLSTEVIVIDCWLYNIVYVFSLMKVKMSYLMYFCSLYKVLGHKWSLIGKLLLQILLSPITITHHMS